MEPSGEKCAENCEENDINKSPPNSDQKVANKSHKKARRGPRKTKDKHESHSLKMAASINTSSDNSYAHNIDATLPPMELSAFLRQHPYYHPCSEEEKSKALAMQAAEEEAAERLMADVESDGDDFPGFEGLRQKFKILGQHHEAQDNIDFNAEDYKDQEYDNGDDENEVF